MSSSTFPSQLVDLHNIDAKVGIWGYALHELSIRWTHYS